MLAVKSYTFRGDLVLALNSERLFLRRWIDERKFQFANIDSIMTMNKSDIWKNFRLGEELHISGAFIYNGLRRYFELYKLDHVEDIFEIFYNLSVGFERLLKITVVLLEHSEKGDQEKLETSLKTHNHLELLRRVKTHRNVKLAKPHNEILKLLADFYKTRRYDRFSISSITNRHKERDELTDYFAKHLKLQIAQPDSMFGIFNDTRYKKFLRKVVQTICRELYEIVRSRAQDLNLYTYELRHGSKAQTIFLGDADIPAENVLWKELLIFFMNTKTTSGYLEYLRSIPPLDFDPGDIRDYLDCFQSDAAKSFVVDELEHHYLELEGRQERLRMIDIIGSPGVDFEDTEE